LGLFAAVHESASGTLLPRANAAACPQLAKADFASSSQHVREGQRIAALEAEIDALQRHVDDVIYGAMQEVQGVLVMFSPDEEARLKSRFCSRLDKKKGFDKLDGQARPNVIFEAGLALGAHSKKTLLVQVGNVRDISDIAGKHLVHLSNSAVSRKELAQRLQTKLKFKVDTTGNDWLRIGNFDR
jgi:hypothetical protein